MEEKNIGKIVQVIGPDGDSGPQRLYIASEMYRQIRYPQQAQYAVQCFR